MTNLVLYLKLIFAIAIWAGLYHVAKLLLVPGINPCFIIFLRYFISSFVLLYILKLRTGKIFHKIDCKGLILLTLIAIIGVFLYNLLFLYAEILTSGNLVAIMYAFTPCITVFLSSILFRLPLGLGRISGLLIALSGAIGVINYASASCGQFFCLSTFSNLNLGIIYAIGASVCFAIYSIINRYLLQNNLKSIVINTYSAIISVVLLVIINLYNQVPLMATLDQTTLTFWIAMLYMSILATVFAYLFYTDALAGLGILRVVICQNTLPMQTIILGCIFFNEQISLSIIACSLLVIVGVIITSIARR
jgi:drug/metabolite transporter (DMT)-like permease